MYMVQLAGACTAPFVGDGFARLLDGIGRTSWAFMGTR